MVKLSRVPTRKVSLKTNQVGSGAKRSLLSHQPAIPEPLRILFLQSPNV